MNPWHDVEIGNNVPDVVSAIIEIPKGSKNKYELDKKTGMIKVDRVLYSSMHYPVNYGFVPQTYCDDNDPLDILVLGQEAVHPLSIIQARPIGCIKMLDQGEEDDKIISVHVNDPAFKDYQSIDELPKHILKELKRFFQDYKSLENKEVLVEELLGPDVARQVVQESVELYKKVFSSK